MNAVIMHLKRWSTWAFAAACVALAWFFFRPTEVPLATLVVHPSPFLQQVSVSGKVAAPHDVNLGFAQGGRIERVYVKVGDRVHAGDTLAYVENADLRALILQKEAAVASARAQLRSLTDGTRPEQLAIDESAAVQSSVAYAQSNEALLDAIRGAYTAADDAVRNKVDTLLNNPQNDSRSLKFSTSDNQTATLLLAERGRLGGILAQWEAGVPVLSVSGNLSGAADEAQTNLEYVAALLRSANSVLSSAISNQSVSQTQLDTYTSSISTARAAVGGAQTALTTARTSQRAAQTALTTAEHTLALARAGSTQTALDEQRARVAAAEADAESARAQLQKTLVTAPFSGTITNVDAKEGEVAAAGAASFSLISNGVFQIEAFIPEINVALVSARDLASVTLDAYGDLVPFGASVVSIDPAETVRDGVSTYRALLLFDAADERIRSGMTANVLITTQQRDGVIAVPQGALKNRSGSWYVDVRQGNTSVERAVAVGDLSSSGDREILSGLFDGDIVILPAPATK